MAHGSLRSDTISPEDLKLLSRIWPDDIAECACATMLHYEDFHVEVRVIGSNTHSVLNCMSLWVGRHAAAMVAWARETSHPAPEDSWQNGGILLPPSRSVGNWAWLRTALCRIVISVLHVCPAARSRPNPLRESEGVPSLSCDDARSAH